MKSGKGKWRGQRTIALNKHMGEGLRFRNKMAYDLIKGIDQMMGLRTQFVHLYVKDETSGSDPSTITVVHASRTAQQNRIAGART